MGKLEQLIKSNYFKSNYLRLMVIAGLSIGSGCRDNSYRHNSEYSDYEYYDSGNGSSYGRDESAPDLIVSKESNYSSPQQTYNSLVYALKKGDLEKALECFDPSSADREKLKNFDLVKLGEQIDNIALNQEYLIAPAVTQIEYTAEDDRKLPLIMYQELNLKKNVYEWKIHVLL